MRIYIVLLAGVLVLAGYVASPYLAMYRINQAIQQRDPVALEYYADWPALREHFRSDLNGLFVRTTVGQSGPDSAVGAARGAMLGPVIIDRLVDAWVTPDGVIQSMQQTGSPYQQKNLRDFVSHAFFEGPTTFRIELRNPESENKPHWHIAIRA